MNGPIGYYVHHHGDGHRQRALTIAKAAPGCFTLLGSGLTGRSEGISYVDLADDYGGKIHSQSGIGVGESLHYAPHGHDGIRQRVAVLSDWIMREKPALIVVDVSVEVAMLARLTSTPMVYVRLSGNRNDPPHLDAFRAAVAVIAPFHRDLDGPDVAAWVIKKTAYVPGLSRVHGWPILSQGGILVVGGRGGSPLDLGNLAAAAAATPDKRWRVIGPVTSQKNALPNLVIAGWVENIDEEIANAGIVVGQAGDGLVSAVIAAGRPFICLPEERPFDEQKVKARRLESLGVAVVLESWPPAIEWPGLLRRAQRLNLNKLRSLHDPDGAARAATFLKSLL
jgi:hypothetical protein